MSGGQILDGKRGSFFWMEPEFPKLTIIGLDTKHRAEHPLYDERIDFPLDETLLDAMMNGGAGDDPILIVKDGDDALLVDGRQCTRHAREVNKRLKKLGRPLLKLKVIVFDGSLEEAALKGAMLNALRREDTVEMKVSKARRLVKMGHSELAVAAAVCGASTTAPLRDLLAFDALDASVKAVFKEGVIPSITAAVKLAPLKREDQAAEVEKLRADRSNGVKATVEEVRDRVRAKRSADGVGDAVPSKSQLRKVLAQAKEDGEACEIDAVAVVAIRVMVGELKPSALKGFVKTLKRAQANR